MSDDVLKGLGVDLDMPLAELGRLLDALVSMRAITLQTGLMILDLAYEAAR